VTARMDICVLHSGGLDSTAALFFYLSRGFRVQGLHVDYGQAAASTEKKFARELSNDLGIAAPIEVRSPIGKILPDHMMMDGLQNNFSSKDRFERLSDEFFPNRNLFLLTLASVYCHGHRCNTIALGIIDSGEFSYSDTDQYFLRYARRLFGHTVDMEIEAPLIRWNKKRVVKYIRKAGLNPNKTYSCNTQAPRPCERCASCLERRAALSPEAHT
jgi:7-cyano-7-deazaguanine synthase